MHRGVIPAFPAMCLRTKPLVPVLPWESEVKRAKRLGKRRWGESEEKIRGVTFARRGRSGEATTLLVARAKWQAREIARAQAYRKQLKGKKMAR